MQLFLDYIQTRIHLDDPLKELLQTHFQERTVKKGTILLEEGKYCRQLYFIEKGLARTFYYEKGKDISSWFYREGLFLTSWYSFYNQASGFEYIETLEDCKLYAIDYLAYQQLLDKHPKFDRFGRILAEEQLSFMEYYSKGYMFMSAKEKYDWLLYFF
ncbi:MAG: cyclic nucleotide-binding domain-containing protein, partial [Bacteroidota bacterium]